MGKRILASFFFAAGVLVACGPTAISIKSGIDTPDHHVATGMRLLETGKVDDAYREFSRARELNPRYAPAYVGLGLVAGMRGEVKKGLAIMEAAMALMRGEEAGLPSVTDAPGKP